MPAAEVAAEHYTAQQVLVQAAAATAAAQWATVDPAAIAQTWQAGAAIVAGAVAGAQLAAAQSADAYIREAMLADGMTPEAVDELVAGSFAGVTADGRNLYDLIYQPAITSLIGIRGGANPRRSLAAGLAQLNTLVRTEVADAGRIADQVAATTAGADGYVRMVVGNTCSRCILLAGRWYRYSAGFERHPKCDCVMVPAAEGDEPLTSPEAIYADMTPEERTRAGWTQADQAALDLGADISQVTNVHRSGVYVAGGRQYTQESTTRRGVNPGRARLTPRQIFIEAKDDRGEAIRLLRRFGYIR